MIDYVELENLPTTSNHLLNILWDRNCAMRLPELANAVNSEFSTQWNKQDIRDFVRFLILADYVERKRSGFHIYYAALGMDYEL